MASLLVGRSCAPCCVRSSTSRKPVPCIAARHCPLASNHVGPGELPQRPRPAAAPTPLVLAAVAAILTASPAFAADTQELFTYKCAGCHMNGGNVLAVGATLFPEDLRKNGVDSTEALYSIIYSGKAKMPGFGKDCAPKGACTFGPRLSDEEVGSLVAYVQERAAAGWKQ